MTTPIGEALYLGQTNVSQPELHHTPSQRSVAASEDWYSVSSQSRYSNEHGRPYSDESVVSALSGHSIRRFQTPPSRRTPGASKERLSLEERSRSEERRSLERVPMRGQGRRRTAEHSIPSFPNPLRSNPRISPIRHQVPSTIDEASNSPRSDDSAPRTAKSSAAKAIDRSNSPPTPGGDDTPYIHFALDQLTRDEEVKGSGGYQLFPATTSQQEPIATWRAATQALRTPDEGTWLGKSQDYIPLPPEMDDEDITPIPPRHPRHSYSRERYAGTAIPGPDLLLPLDPPADSLHPPLGFLPAILRPPGLVLFIISLVLFLAALIFTAIWSHVNTGLWAYGGFGDSRYFVFQYLPTLLGMAMLLWLFEIEIALFRIAPFIALSSENPKSRSHGALLPLVPSGFLLPTLVHFKAAQPTFGFFFLASWSTIFTIPLLSSSFNVRFRGYPGQWVWLATQGVIWVVVALYILLLVATIALMAHLHRRQTGLKWDPTSLADLMVILERSNLLDAYASHTHSSSLVGAREEVGRRNDRLGYWRSTNHPDDIIHTLGAPNKPTRRSSEELAQHEKIAQRFAGPSVEPESGRPFSHATSGSLLRRSDAQSPDGVAPDHLPWVLWPTISIIHAVTATLLLLAFLVVSYLPSTVVFDGFLPDLPEFVDRFGFSADNFLYSFIPSLLGLLCLVLWYSLDLVIRRLQPYATLSTSNGALAERTLLLSYPSDGLLLTTLNALIDRHFRVAAMSLTTLIAAALPILGGGVFWAEFYVSQQRIRIVAHMPAFYALTVLVTLYALAYWLLPISRRQASRYALPNANKGTCIVDVVALVHRSRLLNDATFRNPASKTALVTRLLAAPAGQLQSQGYDEKTDQPGEVRAAAGASRTSLADSLRGFGQARQKAISGQDVLDTPRYALGRYCGRDGGWYSGIDGLQRIGVPGMVVRDV